MDPNNSQSTFIHKIRKYGLITLSILGMIIMSIVVLLIIISSSRSSNYSTQGISEVPSMSTNRSAGTHSFSNSLKSTEYDNDGSYSDESYVDPLPEYNPTVYVPGLESYETTDYQITARTRQFEEGCSLLRTLKTDTRIYFKSLYVDQNVCSALFFSAPDKVDSILNQLKDIRGAEVSESTQSVTRTREVLQTETQIVTEQLSSVVHTLADAEIQYAVIAEFARANNEAAALTEAIRDKLQILESLTQQRIQLTAQLQQLQQQATDLNERIGMIAFTVNINRSFAFDPEETSREWETSWHTLKNTVTSVLIGFTTYLGVFILRALQFAFYALILIFIARYGWKVVHKIWQL